MVLQKHLPTVLEYKVLEDKKCSVLHFYIDIIKRLCVVAFFKKTHFLFHLTQISMVLSLKKYEKLFRTKMYAVPVAL